MPLDLPPPFNAAWFRFILGFIIGSALGSFGTMLAYRVPRRLSILFPRSHCTTCNTTLGIRDLVPIFSYLTSRGRCRHCGAKISILYLFIELIFSFICGIIAIMIGLNTQ